jgi:hypothetical protein
MMTAPDDRWVGGGAYEAYVGPVLYSLVSGCLWAVIGFAIAWSVAPMRSTPSDVVRGFSGGLVAAPFIGLLIGTLARNFSRLGQSARIAVALADLYLAVWLFLLASSVVGVLAGNVPWSRGFEALVSDPIVGTLLGLTSTGFVLLLWPVSYVNHTLVGRAWNQEGVHR